MLLIEYKVTKVYIKLNLLLWVSNQESFTQIIYLNRAIYSQFESCMIFTIQLYSNELIFMYAHFSL